jgi:uncharacterized membrane protein
MTVYDKGLITVCVTGILFVLISLPLIFRKIPPNPIYGYRTRATLSDESLWYDANAYFGRKFVACCMLTIITAFAVDKWRGVAPDIYLKISIALLVAPVILAGLMTSRFIRRQINTKHTSTSRRGDKS